MLFPYLIFLKIFLALFGFAKDLGKNHFIIKLVIRAAIAYSSLSTADSLVGINFE